MNCKWEIITKENRHQVFFQKIANESLPEALDLEEAVDRLNQLEKQLAAMTESYVNESTAWAESYKQDEELAEYLEGIQAEVKFIKEQI